MIRRAFLGLGGNIGDPRAQMSAALRILSQHRSLRVLSVSRLYRTAPWGVTDQPEFLNACAAIETNLGPHDILALCLDAEKQLHRIRTERWGPRTIDIDLIHMDGVRLNEAELTLPHPRATERAFVMRPLADIDPDLEFECRTVSAHLRDLPTEGLVVADENPDWWR